MEKLNLQTEQLKLNVTNIKSVLIDSNKRISKLKNDKNTLLSRSVEKKKFISEEKRLESRNTFSSIANAGKAVVGKTLSFFDKLKEFLGLVLLGIVVNNLPRIISTVKKFFDDNPWIGNAIKFTFDLLGKGLNGLISIVDFFSPREQKKISADNENLKSEFEKLDRGLSDDIASLQTPTDSEEPSSIADQSGGLGMPDTPIEREREQPSPPITPPEEPKRPKYKEGGKVPKSSTTSSASTNIREKKAIQTSNYFGQFRSNYVRYRQVTEQNEKNKTTFENIIQHLKDINSSFDIFRPKKKPMHGQSQRSGGGSSSPAAGSQVYDGLPDSAIVGRVGFTGSVVPKGPAGAHVHIETGSGRGDNRGPVPQHIFDKVIVGGRPLSQWNMNSGYGYRWGNYFHDGHDFAMAAGNPIQLHKDLKLVEYAPGNNAGFGNLIMFTDKQGNTYIITHLQSGPERAASRTQPTPDSSNNNDKGSGGLKPIQISHSIGEDVDDESDIQISMIMQPMIIKQKVPVLLPLG